MEIKVLPGYRCDGGTSDNGTRYGFRVTLFLK